MIRILVALCLVFGGMEAFGEEKKRKEKWYGILGGLSQLYLKDELGSYLRSQGQTRSLALIFLTQKIRSDHSGFMAFDSGKLSASSTHINLTYLQIEYAYRRYFASHFKKKMRLGIQGGIATDMYRKKYIHEGIIWNINFSLNSQFQRLFPWI